MCKVIVTLTALTALAATACTSGGPTSGTAVPPITTNSPTATSPAPQWTLTLSQTAYQPTIDPTKFTTNITNKYFPLVPGTVMVYQGRRDGVPLRIELTVTPDTKTILGVKCLVIRDIVSGALDERTADWYAQDNVGNVWYFGEDTKEYTNGIVSSTAGTWTAGVDGVIPGIIMEANPKVGDAYRQEFRPTVAEDVALVKGFGTAKVPAGSYSNTLITNDRDLLDTSKNEYKYYSSGVGVVKLDGLVNGHKEHVWLKSILKTK